MEFKSIVINGKQIKHYLRLCLECGDNSWKIFNATRPITTMCSDCSIDYSRKNNSIAFSGESMIQDEDKNDSMIAYFLSNSKPSVVITDSIDVVVDEPLMKFYDTDKPISVDLFSEERIKYFSKLQRKKTNIMLRLEVKKNLALYHNYLQEIS